MPLLRNVQNTTQIKTKGQLNQLIKSQLGKIAVCKTTEKISEVPIKAAKGLSEDVFEFQNVNYYKTFQEKCTGFSENTDFSDIVKLKEYFLHLRNKALRTDAKLFCDEMTTIATDLHKSKNPSHKTLSSMFISELIKTQTQLKNYEEVVNLSKMGLEISEEKNDKVHSLARLHELKDSYSKLEMKKESYESTKKALNCVDFIIKNYEEATNNYQSISSKMPPKENFLREKAYLQSELATMIVHKKRNKAVLLLKEARETFKTLKLTDDVKFTEVRISRIKKSKMINKLQEYPRREMIDYLQSKIRREGKNGAIQVNKSKKVTQAQFRKHKSTEI